MLGALDTNRTSETEVEESPPRHQIQCVATNQTYYCESDPLNDPLAYFFFLLLVKFS